MAVYNGRAFVKPPLRTGPGQHAARAG